MDEKLMKQIVEAVMQELMAQRSNASACTEGLDKLLVIGDLQAVPADMAEKYQIFLIDDYIQNKNIHRYQKILITSLTLVQMSDIAQGRDGSPEACAVINGLLNGLDVCMTEAAFPHRKYAGKSSSRLYEVIENNARMLQSFGIKLLKECKVGVPLIPAKPPKYQAPPIEVPKGTGHTTTDRLITEDVARSLIDGGNTAICLAANAIVTPSAWDLFKQKGIEVIRK